MADQQQKVDRIGAGVRRHRLMLLIALGIAGVIISVAAMWHAQQLEERVLVLAAATEADEYARALEREVDRGLERIRVVAEMVAASENLGYKQFARIARPTLGRQTTVDALSWIPRVMAQERAALEAEMRTQGQIDFVIRQHQGKQMVPAEEREVYFPVVRLEPLEKYPNALGFDMSSDPTRKVAMERARDVGRPKGTPPTLPIANARGQLTMLVFVPVYNALIPPTTEAERRSELRGFVAGGVLIDSVLAQAVASFDRDMFVVELHDATDPAATVPLRLQAKEADSPEGPPDGSPVVANGQAASALVLKRDISMAGRRLELVLTPTEDFLAAHASNRWWVVLAIGLLTTGLVVAIAVGLFSYGEAMARYAQQREIANAHLEERLRDREVSQRALARANEELRATNEEMERFVSAVSHDLKTPLLEVDLMVAVLRKELDRIGHQQGASRPVAAGAALDDLVHATKRMRRIIDDLLEHSRAGFAPVARQVVSLEELVMETVDDYREQINRCGARVEVESDLPSIDADRGRLSAALHNLLGNALKYGCPTDHADPSVRIGTANVGEELHIYVQDNGPGVPEEFHDRVFDLFQRLHSDGEGTGIGLAIVKRVAQAHGGRAWVTNGDSGGAVFWIAIPQRGQHHRRPQESQQLSAAS